MIGVNWTKTAQPLMKLEQLVSFHWATGVPCAFLLRSWAVLFLLGMKYDRRCPQSGYKDKETPPKRTRTDDSPSGGIIVITLQCCQISYHMAWVESYQVQNKSKELNEHLCIGSSNLDIWDSCYFVLLPVLHDQPYRVHCIDKDSYKFYILIMKTSLLWLPIQTYSSHTLFNWEE